MRRRTACLGTLGVLLLCVATLPVATPQSFAAQARSQARQTSLPPEFSGTVTFTFDVSASESTSDMEPGHYDTSHLFGSVTLRPRQGSTSALFDPYLYSATSDMAVTSTMTRYAPQGSCQNYEFHYAPTSGYPGFPAYFGVETPELSLMNGFRWGIYPGLIVGAQSNGCPGQDGNWPIDKFDELVGQFVQGPVHNADQNGGRLHLSGTKTVSLSSPAVVRYNKNACPSDGIYFDPCVTSLQIQMDYDLQRISPDRRASQYPRLILQNDRRGNDQVTVRTDTAVRNTKVVVYRVTRGSGVMKSVGSPLTNRKGVVRFTLKDSQRGTKRWFIAYVDGTSAVLPGVSTTQSIR